VWLSAEWKGAAKKRFPAGCWRVNVRIDGKSREIEKYYPNEEAEAAKRFDRETRKIHGDDAPGCNFDVSGRYRIEQDPVKPFKKFHPQSLSSVKGVAWSKVGGLLLFVERFSVGALSDQPLSHRGISLYMMYV
jgi:hypothetical protein